MAKSKRFVEDLIINKPDDFVSFMMNDFLVKNGYAQKQVNGEWVWQDGIGMVSAPKFLKYSYQNGVIHLEAWLKTAWLPGVYGKDMDFTGAVGALIKQSYKKEIDNLIMLLNQPLPSDVQYGQIPGMNAQPGVDGQPARPILVKGVDNSKKAITGFVCSLIACPVGFFLIPIIGLILGIFGIVSCTKALKSSRRGLAIAGLVLGILAIILAVTMWILNIIAITSGVYGY